MLINGDENVLIITLDSCRWDTFERADSPNFDNFCKFKLAYSNGTYTLPSHISIYKGILPNSLDNRPYYNRFRRDLFRISYREKENDNSIFQFAGNEKNIITGFKSIKYKTFGIGAVSWFKDELLNSDYDNFLFSGIDIQKQIDFALNFLTDEFRFFGLINIGETHEPYEFGGMVRESLVSRARMRNLKNTGYLKEEHEKQIAALEFVDKKLEILWNRLSSIKRKTVVVVCGDHGECFGEDGFYGHGFFHRKIIEVPFGIFIV